MYNNEILEAKKYLNVIATAMNKVLELSAKDKNKKTIKTQVKLFDKLRSKASEDKFYKFWQDYSKKTIKNLSKLKNRYEYVSASKIEEIIKNSYRGFESNHIAKVIAIIGREKELESVIEALSREYNETIRKIQRYKNSNELEIEREKEREKERAERQKEYNEPRLTPEQLEQKRKEEEQIENEKRVDENSSVLLAGPKRTGLIGTLQGKDSMLKDMEYLYGFAIDMLIIMESTQHVDINSYEHGENSRIYNAYFESIYDKKSKIEMLLKAYGVSNVDELLNKYESVRNLYYKKYKKLSSEKKAKYAIANFDTYDISSSLKNGSVSVTLLSSLQNEQLEFPPSKDKLIQLINSRIMNGKNYKLVTPKKGEEVITAKPEDYQQYFQAKQYYINLTKNMDIEEVKELYKRVIDDMHNGFKYSSLEPKEINAYYAVMQKLFCEVIFDKKKMKISDSKQYDAAIKEIAETILNENLDFSIYGYDKVTEEEQQKRQTTIEQEYIRYLANLKNKKDKMSFRDFAKQKYNVTNVYEPKNIEERVEEEIKGMKK